MTPFKKLVFVKGDLHSMVQGTDIFVIKDASFRVSPGIRVTEDSLPYGDCTGTCIFIFNRTERYACKPHFFEFNKTDVAYETDDVQGFMEDHFLDLL